MPGGIDIPVIILANKGDVTTETVPPSIDDFCRNNNILKWFITSAKDNIQIGKKRKRISVCTKLIYIFIQMMQCLQWPMQH